MVSGGTPAKHQVSGHMRLHAACLAAPAGAPCRHTTYYDMAAETRSQQACHHKLHALDEVLHGYCCRTAHDVPQPGLLVSSRALRSVWVLLALGQQAM